MIPELNNNKNLEEDIKLLDLTPKKIRTRLAALLKSLDLAICKKTLRRLKFSNKQIREVINLLKNFNEISQNINTETDFSDAELRQIIYENKQQLGSILAMLKSYYENHKDFIQYFNKFGKIKKRMKVLGEEMKDRFFL